MTAADAHGIEALAPRPLPQGVDPDTLAQDIVRRSKTSFAAGMAILSRPRRQGIWALYAFARVIDDIADEPWPLADKHRLLTDWRAEIAALYAGRPRSGIGQALAGPVARYDLPEAEFLALIDGMQMDVDGPIIAPAMQTLRLYTRRVAGAVGMLSMRIFGAWRGEVSARFALALADALQLTNIARDAGEDARIGRLYLPAEILDAHGLPHDPAAAAAHPDLGAARAALGQLAAQDFATAHGLIGAHSRRALAPALMMMGVYRTYLERMQAQGFQGAPARLSKGAKLWQGLRCWAAPGTSRAW